MAPAVDVRGLTKTFETGRRRSRRRVEAVRDIAFAVEPGERLAYIGPNGEFRIVPIQARLDRPVSWGFRHRSR